MIECEDCGRRWECLFCANIERNNRTRRLYDLGDPLPINHQQRHHDSAARVQGWTVWHEHNGTRRTTLCPACRATREIPHQIRPLA